MFWWQQWVSMQVLTMHGYAANTRIAKETGQGC